MTSELWQDDNEYETKVIARVELNGDGTRGALKFEGSWMEWLSVELPFGAARPVAGNTVRLFGKGYGFAVRGVVVMDTVNGPQVLRYATAAQEEQRERDQTASWEADRKKRDAEVKAAGRDEHVMRDEKPPSPSTLEELSAYIADLTSGPHTYGTCVYAVSLATVGTFNYMASELGITGFQAGMADLDVLRRTRSIDGPFMLITAHDHLYPQSDVSEKLAEALQSWRGWLREAAKAKLAEYDTRGFPVHPDVLARWKKLASEDDPAL